MSLCLPTASVSSRRVLWVDLHARWVVNGVVFYGVRSVSKRWLLSTNPKEMGSLYLLVALEAGVDGTLLVWRCEPAQITSWLMNGVIGAHSPSSCEWRALLQCAHPARPCLASVSSSPACLRGPFCTLARTGSPRWLPTRWQERLLWPFTSFWRSSNAYLLAPMGHLIGASRPNFGAVCGHHSVAPIGGGR